MLIQLLSSKQLLEKITQDKTGYVN